jgi:hypothetical protein
MVIAKEDAARALKEAEAAAGRSSTAIGYDRASPHLLLWGGIWVVMNLLGMARAPYGAFLFPLLMLAGVAGSAWFGFRAGSGPTGNRGAATLVIAAAFTLFAFGVQALAPTNSFIVAEGVMCLAIGMAYMVMGISVGWRLSAVGAAIMLATIFAGTWGRDQFFLWMALAGGGGLILGGLWLRRA